MAEDADVGVNAKMTYTLNEDLEGSSTFTITTDPVTQEGVVVLAQVDVEVTPVNISTKKQTDIQLIQILFI